MLRPRLLTFLIAALVGCASSRPAWVIAEYDSEWEPGWFWRTATSPHFVVHGQTSTRNLEQALSRFEETRVALARFLFRDTSIPIVEAVILHPRDFDEVVGTGVAGLFVPGVGRNGSLLVVRDIQEWRHADMVLAHELAHRFVAARYRRLPNWVEEGLASFLESVEVREGSLRFGATPTTASHFQLGGGVSFNQLLAARPEDLYGAGGAAYYSTAWAVIHHLLTAQTGTLERFHLLLARLDAANGLPSAALQAFQEAYPEKTMEELEQAALSSAAKTTALGAGRAIHLPFERPAALPVTVTSADTDRVRLLVRTVQARYHSYRRRKALRRRKRLRAVSFELDCAAAWLTSTSTRCRTSGGCTRPTRRC